MSLKVTLIGCGAIGRALLERTASMRGLRMTHVVVPAASLAKACAQVPALPGGSGVSVALQVPADADLVIECAGHQALTQHVLPALQRGIECAVLSIGALSEEGLPEQLAQAAAKGQTQVHVLSGAIGGVDALASARLAGLEEVSYTARKPPEGWRGTPAEQVVDLAALREPAVILQASAREAARLYPKNANVAATIALAGVGMECTQVRLIADPTVRDNMHEIQARGAFGEMHITMRGKPLPDNPKTSALTVLSALRFLQNKASPWVV